MKQSMLILLLMIPWACAQDPMDEVRGLRRKYDLSIDFTANKDNIASYEIKVQNGAGDHALQEITVRVLLMDKDKNVLWSVQKELDVSKLGHYASESFTFREAIDEAASRYEMYDVVLAPDNESSDYQSYKEFMRAAR